MESPNKRVKQSLPENDSGQDFVALGGDDETDANDRFDYGAANGVKKLDISQAPRAPRAMYQTTHTRDVRNDPRHAKDRPKSKHALPGNEPWVLVKTKYGRRFVHNSKTNESSWHIPPDVMPGVLDFEQWEAQQGEKQQNARWAEEQLNQIRPETNKVDAKADGDSRSRRRRSESLQREDEAALMAELAAEAEHAEEQDVKSTVEALEPLQPVMQQSVEQGYGSDSSYEEVEVTDSEFEDNEQRAPATNGDAEPQQDGPVEFDEDDIAYQLAAMEGEEDYSLNGAEDGDEGEAEWDEGGDESAEEDGGALFRAMLSEHNISPFTPWEKLINDSSSILSDERYIALPNMAARKSVWSAWVKDAAAALKEQRSQAQKSDPKVPYLSFLAAEANTPKLYWPEFKRKHKKIAVMTDRALSDKEREKIYREHINRLKLPESTRKADLRVLLESVPAGLLNKETRPEELPEMVRGNVCYVSLQPKARDEVVRTFVSRLPPR